MNLSIRSKETSQMQWFQHPNELIGDVNNVRSEARRHFRNKKKEYLKDKMNELATNSKNKNIRDLYRRLPT
jgi:superoxide dismutase